MESLPLCLLTPEIFFKAQAPAVLGFCLMREAICLMSDVIEWGGRRSHHLFLKSVSQATEACTFTRKSFSLPTPAYLSSLSSRLTSFFCLRVSSRLRRASANSLTARSRSRLRLSQSVLAVGAKSKVTMRVGNGGFTTCSIWSWRPCSQTPQVPASPPDAQECLRVWG